MRVVLTPEKNCPSNRRSRLTRAISQTPTSRVPVLVLADDGVRLRRAITHSQCYFVAILCFGKTEAMVAARRFFGWSVAWSTFAIAVFAWGIGFYGPSVFLQSLHQTRGWPISQISIAVTAHFLLSAIIIACLPELHRRLGIAKTTFLGAVLTAAGLVL